MRPKASVQIPFCLLAKVESLLIKSSQLRTATVLTNWPYPNALCRGEYVLLCFSNTHSEPATILIQRVHAKRERYFFKATVFFAET